MDPLVLLIVSATVIILLLSTRRKFGKNVPPGPAGLPVVGNLLQLGKFPHLKLDEWGYEFGEIFNINMGRSTVTVLSDAQLIKEAFNNPDLNGRPDIESFNILAGGKHGIISSDGPVWQEQRRFTLKALKNFGFGKNDMEELIMTEVNEYLTWLKSNEGKSFSMVRQFSLAVLNSLWMILAGKRYRHDDPRLVDIFEQNTRVSVELSNSPAIFMPRVAKWMPTLSGWDKLASLMKSMKGVCVEAIEEHKRNFSDEDNPRDFIDAYLSEIKATKDPNSSFYKEAGDVSLRAVIGDMFGAGSETTALTLSWSVLYLSKFLHVQKKLQRELDLVVGKNRQPSLADRPNLPYCEATCLEVLRTSSIAPIGVFHVAMTDVKLGGYDIPKNSWLIPNQFHLHYREDIWGDPFTFRPERHLTDGGKTVQRHESLMPFSTGKRVCVGLHLARDEFFLFLTNIFLRFSIILAPDSQNVSLDSKPGFLLAPQEFNVIVQDRV